MENKDMVYEQEGVADQGNIKKKNPGIKPPAKNLPSPCSNS